VTCSNATYDEEDLRATADDKRSSYFGGKGGAGTYQTIINMIPPHEIYIETHLGGGAIMRHKKMAAVSIGIDVDPWVVDSWRPHSRDITLRNVDATRWLQGEGSFYRRYKNKVFIYCDPPYLPETLKSRPRYNFNMGHQAHIKLLAVLKKLPCNVMISGYWSDLYAVTLKNWRAVSFESMTRRGKATEWVWMNYPEPTELHDYRYLGRDFRERERIRRKRERWVRRLQEMPQLERMAMVSTINKIDEHRSAPFTASGDGKEQS